MKPAPRSRTTRATSRTSNTAWKKRVDHREKREPQPTRAEPAVCSGCGAIYHKRRWVSQLAPEMQQLASRAWEPARKVLCPACRSTADGIPSGWVELSGTFLGAHRDEITTLLRNEAERAAQEHPLGKIMKIAPGRDGGLTVTTTNEHLAQRLGHALHKAYQGETRYDFSHENKVARVYWHRD